MRACIRVCVRACVCACVRACARVRVRVCVQSFGHIRSYKWKVNIPMKGLWLQDIPDNSLPGTRPSLPLTATDRAARN
jgi:hypothetical protein